MARFATAVESQTAQLAGNPSGTTFNGYFAAVVAGSANGFLLRRCFLGVRAGASVPTSQQMTVALTRQTVRAVGTGFSTKTGQNCELYTTASAISGIDVTTAATAGTTGPTVSSTYLHEFSFNTQSGLNIPAELRYCSAPRTGSRSSTSGTRSPPGIFSRCRANGKSDIFCQTNRAGNQSARYANDSHGLSAVAPRILLRC
jgi:hypothetical protein